MVASTILEPDPGPAILYVGQDGAGHWLVQDSRKLLEGCFISFAAALHFAQSERHLYHAVVEVSAAPLSPRIAYRPVDAHAQARARAA